MRRRKSSSSTNTTTTVVNRNEVLPATFLPQTIEIPITDDKSSITVHLPTAPAAIKIQSAYRSHLIRTLFKTISTVNSQADHLQNLIQRQDTVDSIRSSEKEKLRLNEALMALLLKLDSVPGIDPTIREARRKVSRRIVGLQEILDAVSESRVEDLDELMRNWEQVVAEMEGDMCGGDCYCGERRREMERFCFQNLGFRCMERFLRGV
ncbi:fumarylacetoacetase [Ranunculus cassubicifolius]